MRPDFVLLDIMLLVSTKLAMCNFVAVSFSAVWPESARTQCALLRPRFWRE